MTALLIILGVLAAFILGVAIYDVVQRHNSILRNFPVIGHLRFILEALGPELRQYIVTENDVERPFNRDQRRWVYRTAEGGPSSFGFGTDNDIEASSNYIVIRQSMFPKEQPAELGDEFAAADHEASAKVMGEAHGRKHAFRPSSIVNISGMSFGALGSHAVMALNKGAALSGCLQSTGEGGLSDYHLQGGDLVFQLGTAYFGCRDADGNFSLPHLLETISRGPVKALEIKLSQGAKPGLGGRLPAAKNTPEIAAIRGITPGVDCESPSSHSAFGSVPELCDFVEMLAAETGLPIGIKSAVGELGFWTLLADRMASQRIGPDFITIDGGEGGTGAAPLVFTDHVSLPFFWGFGEVYRRFVLADIADEVTFIGSGRLGLPDRAVLAMAMGADMINVAREAMLSIGCIQAQRCETGRCPTGVTTSNRRLQRGLDPADKSVKSARFIAGFRRELISLGRAMGHEHPAMMTLDDIGILDQGFRVRGAAEIFDYDSGWGTPSDDMVHGLKTMVGNSRDRKAGPYLVGRPVSSTPVSLDQGNERPR